MNTEACRGNEPCGSRNPVTGLDHTIMPKVTSLPKIPTSVLLVGNSFMYYNNGVVQWLEGMIEADRTSSLRVSMVTIAYAGLDWHDVKSYLRPEAINSYTTMNDGSNRLLFLDKEGPTFDAVLMADNSQGPVHPELKKRFAKYAKIHSDDVRKVGASPMLMMTWAYVGKPEMTRELADETIKVGNDNGMMVVPVGLAFAKALESRPDLRLNLADNRHPSIAGTYLETCVFYAALLRKSPEGIPWFGLGELLVSPDDGAFLQKTAWDTVKAFYGW